MMLEYLVSAEFWVGLIKIIGVNIILSGDNAVVIALAARSLPPKQQTQAIIWGSGAAIVMRIILTLFAVALLTLPWLKIVGSVLLFWIGVKLLVPDPALAGLLSGFGAEFVNGKPMLAGFSLELTCGALGVLIVVALGKWLAKRQEAAAATQRPAEISK